MLHQYANVSMHILFDSFSYHLSAHAGLLFGFEFEYDITS